MHDVCLRAEGDGGNVCVDVYSKEHGERKCNENLGIGVW